MLIDRTKLDRVLRSIEADHGPFVLAGLFMREDSPGRWDLVVSAPWLQRGKLFALGEFVNRLSDVLAQDEVLSLSRIVTLNRTDPALQDILHAIGTITQPVEKFGPNLFGLPLEQAYILRARRRTPSNKRIQPAARRTRRGGYAAFCVQVLYRIRVGWERDGEGDSMRRWTSGTSSIRNRVAPHLRTRRHGGRR